jgi:multidrug resistance efflux pump
MLLGFVLLFAYGFVVWLVFFKFRWLRFTIGWGFFSTFFVLHLGIIFLVGLRYVTPASTEARVIQHTIQLTPRLSEPTLVTAVLVQPNVHVKQGTPLFQFDRRIYEDKVKQLEAQLAQAKQNVLVMKSDVQVATEKIDRLKSELEYATYQEKLSASLAKRGAGPEEDAQKWHAQVAANIAAIKEAQAEKERALLQFQSEIGGVNTSVSSIEAELDQARFYLDNTLMVAPEDGYIINLQVRPGMVSGDIRFGAIASFVCDADRFVLAQFFQENLKYVKPGQPVEVALDLYPGQIWPGKVAAIWQGSGAGQMLPSGALPNFNAVPGETPQGQFAVAITLDDPDQTKFPIGTQGRAAIYTSAGSSFDVLRKVAIRSYTWYNWLYPFSP